MEAPASLLENALDGNSPLFGLERPVQDKGEGPSTEGGPRRPLVFATAAVGIEVLHPRAKLTVI